MLSMSVLRRSKVYHEAVSSWVYFGAISWPSRDTICPIWFTFWKCSFIEAFCKAGFPTETYQNCSWSVVHPDVQLWIALFNLWMTQTCPFYPAHTAGRVSKFPSAVWVTWNTTNIDWGRSLQWILTFGLELCSPAGLSLSLSHCFVLYCVFSVWGYVHTSPQT